MDDLCQHNRGNPLTYSASNIQHVQFLKWSPRFPLRNPSSVTYFSPPPSRIVLLEARPLDIDPVVVKIPECLWLDDVHLGSWRYDGRRAKMLRTKPRGVPDKGDVWQGLSWLRVAGGHRGAKTLWCLIKTLLCRVMCVSAKKEGKMTAFIISMETIMQPRMAELRKVLD